MNALIDRLLDSREPAIRYKTLRNVLQEDEDAKRVKQARNEIRECSRVQALLANRDSQGRVEPADNPYHKWQGAHWVMAALADIGYPTGDESLIALREQLFKEWLSEHYRTTTELVKFKYQTPGVPILNGRARRCASQQGNALYSIITLGLATNKCHDLANLLMKWQWPDGGWNCDKKIKAAKSSFYETITPLRGMIAYAKHSGRQEARESAKKAAEVFLTRKLYKRKTDGERMKSAFTSLHYPLYWHYDILHGLKVMAEGGFIHDERCDDALDLLESMQLEQGGWPATAKHYVGVDQTKHGYDLVGWGGTNKKKMNEWVTVDALAVLVEAGRLSP